MNENKNLYIIDGNYIIYRSHFALISLKNSKGMHTGAIFGFLKTLLKVIYEKNPDYIAIAFDSKEKTFRDHVYADYKINRAPMPEEIIEQLPYILEIINKLGITYIIRDGFEADDIIGSLANLASSMGLQSFIITKDKDMIQLMDGDVQILYCDDKWEIIDDNWVLEKFGIKPGQIIDYLSLVGDSSDNVPGVKGIGPKSAEKLLKKFRSLEDIYDNISDLGDPKLVQKLIQDRENAFLSKDLVTIRKNMDLNISIESLALKKLNTDQISGILEDLEFYSLIRDLGLNREEIRKIAYHIINTPDEMEILLKKIKEKGHFAFYFCNDDQKLAITTDGKSCSIIELTGEKRESEILKNLLENHRIMKISHSIKDRIKLFDNESSYKNIFDTGIAFSLIDPDSNASLEQLFIKYLKKEMAKETDNAINLLCEQTTGIYRLFNIAEKQLQSGDLSKIFYDIEMPLIVIISDMEKKGIRIDPDTLKSLEIIIQEKIGELEREIYDIVGFQFNINSTKELQDILFNFLKLRTGKKIKTGYSTSFDVLKELSASHPLPAKIIDYRSLTKLMNTYVCVLPKLVDRETGRIHTHFNQANIITGRLSSNNPNLQSIPVKGELGSQIRNAFTAPEGYNLLSADYSQIELRVLAHYSLDPLLTEAFIENRDIHTSTATALFAFEDSMITPAMRRIAKAVNFGIIYGISPFGLSRQISIPQAEAKRYIRLFFNRYRGVRAFIDKVIEKASADGYVKTMYGRKRPIPQLRSKNKAMQRLGERLSINTIIQGTAAEIIKIAMINIYNKIKADNIDANMLLQIHDEMLFEVNEACTEDFSENLRSAMIDNFSLNVPLDVNIKQGRNWGEI